MRYHRIVKGMHGLHVYATEYWTDYLLSSAKEIGELEENSTFFLLACQMADKLKLIPDLTVVEQKETQSGVQDDRLVYLQQYPILYNQVKASLGARSIKQLEHELLQIGGRYSREAILSC